MYRASPLTAFFLLALLIQRVVCAPAAIGSSPDSSAAHLQLQLPSTEAHDSNQDTTPREHLPPLGALFPSSIDNGPDEAFITPTRYHSTLLARRLLALSSTGNLATVFPHNISSIPAYSRTPPNVAGISIGLPEYIASCEGTGNPTIIALGVSTSTKNAEYGNQHTHGSNVSLSISWWDQYSRPENAGHEPWSMANLPRLSLLGYLEHIPDLDVQENNIEECFVSTHQDSRLWLPGSKFAAHQGTWARIVVEEIYWIGGFGGTNYIGWLDKDEWRSVKQEWKEVRLRGEKS